MRTKREGLDIRQFAEKTGYSVTTVSHALNNAGRLSEKTREAILKLAKKHGYVKNFFASKIGCNPRPYEDAPELLRLLDAAREFVTNADLREEIDDLLENIRIDTEEKADGE